VARWPRGDRKKVTVRRTLAIVAALALAGCTASAPRDGGTLCPNPVAVDGDTLRCSSGVRVRLDDFDAPEIGHARCGRELRLALAAQAELTRLAPTLRLRQVPCATRNYNRACAHSPGLREHMVKLGLAVSYDCGPGWCPPHTKDWCRT
jgi:endonuclease YncB( thermonuclease family)